MHRASHRAVHCVHRTVPCTVCIAPCRALCIASCITSCITSCSACSAWRTAHGALHFGARRKGRERDLHLDTCTQACLDHTFAKKRASCLVNPRAGYELKLNYTPIACAPLRVAVVGAGPAGLACSTVAARRGHDVTLFDAGYAIGGQFNLAKQAPQPRGHGAPHTRHSIAPHAHRMRTACALQVPGKEEFHETLRYYRSELRLSGVTVRLGARVGAAELQGFDRVVLATDLLPLTMPTHLTMLHPSPGARDWRLASEAADGGCGTRQGGLLL